MNVSQHWNVSNTNLQSPKGQSSWRLLYPPCLLLQRQHSPRWKTRDQGLHKLAAFKTARHIWPQYIIHSSNLKWIQTGGGGVIESDHFLASIHHTQFKSELDSITPPPCLNLDLRVGENIIHYILRLENSPIQLHPPPVWIQICTYIQTYTMVIALSTLRIEQAHARRLKRTAQKTVTTGTMRSS